MGCSFGHGCRNWPIFRISISTNPGKLKARRKSLERSIQIVFLTISQQPKPRASGFGMSAGALSFALKRKPKGSVDLAECSLATAEQHTKRANTFGIFHHGRRDYFLEAPSHAVLLEWVR